MGTGPSRTSRGRTPKFWGYLPPTCGAVLAGEGYTADEEARVGWMWGAVVAWALLAAPAAILLGRIIHRADREELEAPAPQPELP